MELNLILRFADPDLMAEMSVAEKLKATLITGLTGLCVTFVVLIALMLIIVLLRRVIGRYELKSEYRRQVHRARKLRSAKLTKRKSEAEQHGFETIHREMRSAPIVPEKEADTKAGGASGGSLGLGEPDEAVVAAIIAAISAYEGTSADQIRIRRIVHRPFEEAVWKSQAGVSSCSGEGWKR